MAHSSRWLSEPRKGVAKRMKDNIKQALLLYLTLFCFLVTPSYARVGSSELPEISDSSATLLSLEDELMIDREMMNRLINSGAMLNDPIVTTYIQELGQSIGSLAATRKNQFQFFVLRDPNINAFAMPGGHIGVNAGLILASRSESELAGVIAHEISHVTQHHIARNVEKANQMQLPLTAAVIAAILLGAGDPQIANAAIAASIGGATQVQLDFSRAHEKEADFIGIQLLASAGYDPQGMSSFFSRMQEGTKYYGAGVPEFLRTHPVTTSRIAEAEGRSRQFTSGKNRPDSINYLLVRARLRQLTATSIDYLERTIKTEKGGTPAQQEAHQYLQALVLQQKGKISEARARLKALLRSHPDRITYIYSLAELENSQKNESEAIALYRKGLRQYPGNPLLTLALAETHIALKQNATARVLLEQLTRKHPNADVYRLQADLEAQAGNMAASHLARAEYYYLIHEPHSALDQLTNAKRLPNLPHYFALRIDALMQQIKDEILLAQERTNL